MKLMIEKKYLNEGLDLAACLARTGKAKKSDGLMTEIERRVQLRQTARGLMITALFDNTQFTSQARGAGAGDWPPVITDLKLLRDMVTAADGSYISLKNTGSDLRIQTRNIKSSLIKWDMDWPGLKPRAEPLARAKLDPAKLARALAGILGYPSKEDTRYNLTKILLEPGPGRLRLAATDGHRMIWDDLDVGWSKSQAELKSLLLPPKAAKLLIKACKCLQKKGGQVQVFWCAAACLFSWPDSVLLVWDNPGCSFPNYRAVIPKRHELTHWAVLECRDLLAALARIKPAMTSSPFSYLMIRWHRDQLWLGSKNEMSTAHTTAPALTCSLGSEISCNYTYLTHAAKKMGPGLLALGASDRDGPLKIYRPGDGSPRVLIMPIRSGWDYKRDFIEAA